MQEDREEKQAAIKTVEIAGMIYAKGLHKQLAVILKSDAYTCSHIQAYTMRGMRVALIVSLW